MNSTVIILFTIAAFAGSYTYAITALYAPIIRVLAQ